MSDSSKIGVINRKVENTGDETDEETDDATEEGTININIGKMYNCVEIKYVIFEDILFCIDCASKFAVEDLSRAVLKSDHQFISAVHGFDMLPDLNGQTQCNNCEATFFRVSKATDCDKCYDTVKSLFDYGCKDGYVIYIREN
ncbi:hypothetical protein [Pseudoplusia includens SNPV IE]|uniref:Uncharacterized protein n=1 Tax=Pseudoplusia includens SNPV IE TaxID=1592335 RepID=A0A0B4ZZJ7_9ABAC|nr:hypothetical protein [Pseudoplusia includens SNPV IE]AJD80798.1 hypothetical protein [Pseudoplusia includens SNPV IE]